MDNIQGIDNLRLQFETIQMQQAKKKLSVMEVKQLQNAKASVAQDNLELSMQRDLESVRYK